MECKDCGKVIEGSVLSVCVCVQSKYGYKTLRQCFDCCADEYNELALDTLAEAAASSHTVDQLNDVWRLSAKVKQWKKTESIYYQKALDIFKERKRELGG